MVKFIKDLIKEWKCKHEYEHYCNLYGDEIIWHGMKRSLWVCKKCGKQQFRDYLWQE